MELPIPSHLTDYFCPEGENSEFEATGKIRCDCGFETFEIFESNERQIIKLVCKRCKNEILLFDSGKHGWNGFVCKEDSLNRNEPFEKYPCKKCKEDSFHVSIKFSSQGKEDFEEECSDDDEFSPKDWVNAFDWIRISLNCEKCGFEIKKWLDMETM